MIGKAEYVSTLKSVLVRALERLCFPFLWFCFYWRCVSELLCDCHWLIPFKAEVLNPMHGVVVSGFCSDVYSFGVVVWEIVTLNWPHKHRYLLNACTHPSLGVSNDMVLEQGHTRNHPRRWLQFPAAACAPKCQSWAAGDHGSLLAQRPRIQEWMSFPYFALKRWYISFIDVINIGLVLRLPLLPCTILTVFNEQGDLRRIGGWYWSAGRLACVVCTFSTAACRLGHRVYLFFRTPIAF